MPDDVPGQPAPTAPARKGRTQTSVLRALFVSSRPLSWINTAFPFAAGYLMTTREVDVTFVIGTLYFLIPYNLAMYGINDVFDYESDLRNPRKGGVEGALLDRRMHRPTLIAAAATNIPFLVYLVIVGSPLSWLVLAISVFAVIAYSAPVLRFKERPVVDSVTSSTHFVSPAIYGLVLAGAIFTPQLWLVLAAFFLWGLASHAFGAVQDIVADREGGIGSIATAFGGAVTVRLSVISYLLAGVLLLFTAWPGPIAAILALPYAASCAPFWSVTDASAETANRGWKRFLLFNFISGFIVTLLFIAYWIGHPAAGA
ncbi:prenyltransferase [Glaciihabitans sp. dw_435]|uniref:prenyltransferase n=1 Tax=Glaciihabitans sp. dw_435 TaxID=2720081 RepID=UPI001C4A2184